jgi:hypothetical protein
MSNRSLTRMRCNVLIAAALCLTCQTAQAGHGFKGCAFCKPKPTGVRNECFGYNPTVWRQWPAECQPCVPPVVTVQESPTAIPGTTSTLPAPSASPAPPTGQPAPSPRP